eukprot:gene3450-3923_t
MHHDQADVYNAYMQQQYAMGQTYDSPASDYYVDPNETWFELRCEPEYTTSNNPNPNPPTCLKFDPWMELLWAGYQNGKVTSLHSPSMERYSSYIHSATAGATHGHHASAGEIKDLLVNGEGVLSLTSNSVMFHTRGGAPLFNVRSDKMRNLNAISYSKLDNSELVVCSDSPVLHVIDFYTGRLIREVSMPCGVQTLNRARGLWCGQANGDISMLDPRTWRIEHSLSAHNADVRSVDMKGDLLASTGCQIRNGQRLTDSVVRIFDVKSLRPLPPVQFKRPSVVKFHPKFYSSIAVISETSAQVQIVDVNDPGAGTTQSLMLDNLYGYVLSFDMSSSGDIMAFGDSGSLIHQWAEKENVRVNTTSYAVDLADFPHLTRPKKKDDDSPLSSVYFYQDIPDNQLLSHWKPTQTYPVGLPQRPLNPSLLAHLKQHDFVGYITNTGISRKQIRGKTYEDGKKTIANLTLSSITQIRPPKSYRWTEIRFTKLGIEEFDVAIYNKTKFSGLENSLINTYSNSCIQTIYFIPHIRNALLNHLCNKNYCLSCELGFIFRRGLNVETSNFLRVLKQFPQAEALGLCLSHENPESIVPLSQLITNFNRFLMEQIHKELIINNNSSANQTPQAPAHHNHHHHNQQQYKQQQQQQQLLQLQQRQALLTQDSVIDTLFGSTQMSANKCINCGHSYEKTSRHFQFDLAYPNQIQELGPDGATFSNLLKMTLSRQTKTPAWCDKCQNYFSTVQKKFPKTLPNILCLNANISKKEHEDLWKFISNSIPGAKPQPADSYDNETTWLPVKVRIKTDMQENTLTVIEYPNNKPSVTATATVTKTSTTTTAVSTESSTTNNTTNTTTTTTITTNCTDIDEPLNDNGQLYELISSISHIKDQVKRLPKNGHIVCQAKVSEYYLDGDVSKSQYYLFNDFKVKSCSVNDVAHFDANWKTPGILFYRKVGYEKSIDEIKVETPITRDVYMANNTITCRNPSFIPATIATIPKTDDLVAIDTEFVSIGPEETEVSSDGKRVIIQPGNFSLARVSLVRENGEAFVDDYIQSIEPVTDYLTRFSGIEPGDLDPKVSTKNVITLKSCYLKLRYLVDQRVKFVGHGLKKDFRIINMYVPPEQIIDTVELFQLHNQRKLSLRFLAYILLKIDIQSETHCSIEDAKTAMELYKAYLVLVKNNEFKETLNKIYQVGRKLNFKVPENQPGIVNNFLTSSTSSSTLSPSIDTPPTTPTPTATTNK